MRGYGGAVRRPQCRRVAINSDPAVLPLSSGICQQQQHLWMAKASPCRRRPIIYHTPMPLPSQPSPVDILLVHSSDLHVDDEANATKARRWHRRPRRRARPQPVRPAPTSCCSPATPSTTTASPPRCSTAPASCLAAAGVPVVILPGNHDPALPNSVFIRGGLAAIPNVAVLGITHDEAVGFPDHDLEIWGHADRDYENMAPLRGPRAPQHAVADRHGARPL